jgi:16S rRNA A1518/A1519 N6-dimethyltransferase RsmA/KsgA/DIM1 with predicted DNA glycosylase/AP lyase activity
VRLERRLPRRAFEPPPGVDAGLLVLLRRERPLVPERCWPRYRAFVAAGFRRGLRAVAPRPSLRSLGLIGAEPRELDPHQWAQLFRKARP